MPKALATILFDNNPTWNSTKLELVGVGVDFVFQCHKNKNKNKNTKNKKNKDFFHIFHKFDFVSKCSLHIQNPA